MEVGVTKTHGTPDELAKRHSDTTPEGMTVIQNQGFIQVQTCHFMIKLKI